jgi:plasmid stability protein
MPTVTIRNLPEPVVSRIKQLAARNGRSMEQEIRSLLVQRYGEKGEIIARARERWSRYPAPSASDLERWRREGRP